MNRHSDHVKRWTIIVLLALAAGGVCGAAEAEQDEPILCQGNYQSEEQAKEQLAKFAATYSNLEEWKSRAQVIREGIRKGLELTHWPQRKPLSPIINNKRVHDGYTVENAAFESLPGVFVTGNLYRPTEGKGLFAGILCPHGHWGSADDYGRFRPDMQYRCATLAKMGAVVFAYDMVG